MVGLVDVPYSDLGDFRRIYRTPAGALSAKSLAIALGHAALRKTCVQYVLPLTTVIKTATNRTHHSVPTALDPIKPQTRSVQCIWSKRPHLNCRKKNGLSPKEDRKKAEAQHKNTSDQGRTWANVAVVKQADLLERNFQLGDEKRQLQTTISELRVMNAALIAQIQGLEKNSFLGELHGTVPHTLWRGWPPGTSHYRETHGGRYPPWHLCRWCPKHHLCGQCPQHICGRCSQPKLWGRCPQMPCLKGQYGLTDREWRCIWPICQCIAIPYAWDLKTNKCLFMCAKSTSEPKKEGGAEQEWCNQCSNDIPNHKTSMTPEK